MEPTYGWQNSAQMYSNISADEVAFLLRNLAHYFAQLKVAKNHKSIEALYLYREISAVVSINTSGISNTVGNLIAYVFPDEKQRVLYLLCIGKVNDKDSDMEYCKSAVISIVNERN
jgi:hypothetical protein